MESQQSSMQDTERTPKTSERFSSPTADVVLRSSDGVIFKVHRVLLAEASPVFRTMFEIPQPLGPAGSETLPTVDITESSDVIDAILRLLYPWPGRATSTVTTLTHMQSCLVAAHKYDIGVVIEALTETLKSTLADKHPFGVYSMLRSLGTTHDLHLPDVIAAAKRCILVSGLDLMNPPRDEIQGLTAVDLLDLVKVKKVYCDAVEDIFTFNEVPRCSACRAVGEPCPRWWSAYRAFAIAILTTDDNDSPLVIRGASLERLCSILSTLGMVGRLTECNTCYASSHSHSHSQKKMVSIMSKLIEFFETGSYPNKLQSWEIPR
ncbi:hypothetical protein BOTBODRAFT_61607 [Botryobasidium botryosum FD-172 SS1]|uniref:BTB domain-containing protein n=1 Tax=Botryobasidium botryosum (strain FD-172 SS1) TaxID=930990 RepID=A0A067MXI9_BOTB1|nr:hypothetical protein BOTBODRAFT_61607 [Botryobasidium botryosum FD-172 SS1]